MPQSIGEQLACAARRLEAVTDTPRLDAELLLAHALGISRASLLARLRETLDAAVLTPLLARRLNHEPLAYIFGEWEFFGLPFYVEAPLLTPRPETEHLVEAVLAHVESHSSGARSPCVVMDVCCGTGCVGVTAAHHGRCEALYACDISAAAVRLTARNAHRHNVMVHCMQGDLVSAFDRRPLFDVIAANPPYVAEGEWSGLSPVITKHEDPRALLAGVDGLALIRKLVPEAHSRLRQGGLLALELGEDQFRQVATLMGAAGFSDIEARRDLADIDRIITGIRR